MRREMKPLLVGLVFVIAFLGVRIEPQEDGGRTEVHEVVRVIEFDAVESALNEASHPRE
jgi:hypothetical protein